jgi:hypothetical protein
MGEENTLNKKVILCSQKILKLLCRLNENQYAI